MKHLALPLSLALLSLSACADDRSAPAPRAEPEQAAAAAAAPGAVAKTDPAHAGAREESPMGCGEVEKSRAASDGAKNPLKQTKFGEAITESQETALADILADPSKFAGKTVRTSGTVLAVCKAAGCWMEVGDENKRAHIKMSGHSFVVPRNSDGHRAVLQGVVKSGEPQNECGSKDKCGGSENGALAKLEIEATGVEFVD
jgi:hypothetical protein